MEDLKEMYERTDTRLKELLESHKEALKLIRRLQYLIEEYERKKEGPN